MVWPTLGSRMAEEQNRTRVFLSVCYKPGLYQNGWTDWSCFWYRGYPRLVKLWSCATCFGREFGHLQKYGYFPLGRCPKLWTLENILQLHVDHRKCCQLRWTLSVINWRRSSVVSLSHWASTFVYNTMGLTQWVARVCVGQLRLVITVMNGLR